MAIRIITDSTSDISVKEGLEIGVGVGSLTVNIDGKEYVEGVDISHENFYKLSEHAKEPILTSQPSPDAFLKLFNEAKEAGDEVLGIFISEQLSGTYQSACIARDNFDYDKIYIIDSQNLSVSLRLMVYTALKLINDGMDYDTLCTTMEGYRDRLQAYTIVGDLKHLKRSGRLSPTTAFVANLFNMKPITTLKGKVEVIGKARGTNAAIAKTFDIIENTTNGVDEKEMAIVGYTGEDTTWYKDLIVEMEKRTKIGKNLKVFPIGASVGNHVGAGSVAVAFFSKK